MVVDVGEFSEYGKRLLLVESAQDVDAEKIVKCPVVAVGAFEGRRTRADDLDPGLGRQHFAQGPLPGVGVEAVKYDIEVVDQQDESTPEGVS